MYLTKLLKVRFELDVSLEDVLVDTDVIEKTTGGYKLKGKNYAEEREIKSWKEGDESSIERLAENWVNSQVIKKARGK